MPSSSCSLTNGPSLSPLPGTSTLVSTISARLTRRSGGNDTSHSVGRAVNSAARSADSTAHVFGTASVKHEEHDDVEHEADGDALGAEQVVGEQRW